MLRDAQRGSDERVRGVLLELSRIYHIELTCIRAHLLYKDEFAHLDRCDRKRGEMAYRLRSATTGKKHLHMILNFLVYNALVLANEALGNPRQSTNRVAINQKDFLVVLANNFLSKGQK